MKRPAIVRTMCLAAAVSGLLGGCGVLNRKPVPQPSFYSLGDALSVTRIAAAEPMAAPSLLVSPPGAAAGFDSARIVYLREPRKLEYFAHSEWIDSPARMLAPMIVSVIANAGVFAAVVPTSGVARGDLSLDTEILRLQQEFEARPSRVRFSLRATLADTHTGRVLAWREFDQTVVAVTDDPHGGVVAAGLAVATVLGQLAVFCNDNAELWRRSAAEITAPAAGPQAR